MLAKDANKSAKIDDVLKAINESKIIGRVKDVFELKLILAPYTQRYEDKLFKHVSKDRIILAKEPQPVVQTPSKVDEDHNGDAQRASSPGQRGKTSPPSEERSPCPRFTRS